METANSKIKPAGRFYANVYRDGKLIHKDVIGSDNIVVDEGLNHLLATEFAGGTPITAWFIAPYINTITPLKTDTNAGIVARAGETELYDEANRVAWDETADQANVKMTNTASQATFTINGTVTVRGAFLVSNAGKSDTAGTLMAVANFDTPRALIALDQLVITYEIAATSV